MIVHNANKRHNDTPLHSSLWRVEWAQNVDRAQIENRDTFTLNFLQTFNHARINALPRFSANATLEFGLRTAPVLTSRTNSWFSRFPLDKTTFLLKDDRLWPNRVPGQYKQGKQDG